jgi:hypothetical protein
VRPWDKHPPWAHWSFYVVWAVAGSVGPIFLLVSLIAGPRDLWWIGFVLCCIWLLDLGADWLAVRRLQRNSKGWTAWQPPRWLNG